ncbi:MAG: YaaR family protein [Treponema sp.]|jgi:uncharacterized protein YaaR (DUF327 family)|nr:YaaR family protein [Treponema sp.]
MANIAFPGASLFNPAAYGEVSAETRKNRSPRKGEKPAEPRKKSFASLFETAAQEMPDALPRSAESIHALLEEVHNAGDSLSKRPFPPEIKAYREAVRSFIQYVVEHSFDTRKETSGANVLKQKIHTLVEVVDKKLEEMASAVLRGQTGQLEILARLDEIKGLLVDLMQ